MDWYTLIYITHTYIYIIKSTGITGFLPQNKGKRHEETTMSTIFYPTCRSSYGFMAVIYGAVVKSAPRPRYKCTPRLWRCSTEPFSQEWKLMYSSSWNDQHDQLLCGKIKENHEYVSQWRRNNENKCENWWIFRVHSQLVLLIIVTLPSGNLNGEVPMAHGSMRSFIQVYVQVDTPLNVSLREGKTGESSVVNPLILVIELLWVPSQLVYDELNDVE